MTDLTTVVPLVDDDERTATMEQCSGCGQETLAEVRPGVWECVECGARIGTAEARAWDPEAYAYV